MFADFFVCIAAVALAATLMIFRIKDANYRAAAVKVAMLFAAYGVIVGFAGAALAQDLPPGITISPVAEPIWPAPAFLSGWVAALWNVLLSPPGLVWLAAQARALIPGLGRLGPITFIGDLIVGNYRYAKNAK